VLQGTQVPMAKPSLTPFRVLAVVHVVVALSLLTLGLLLGATAAASLWLARLVSSADDDSG